MRPALPLVLVLAAHLYAAIPRYERVACPSLDTAAEAKQRVDCGRLTVPEDRAARNDRSVTLVFAVMRSTGEKPKSDAVLVLQGGPGGSLVPSLQAILREKAFLGELRRSRDVVLLDQRGTGLSQPRFCPQLSAGLAAITLRGMSYAESLSETQEQLQICRKTLMSEGLDPEAYNSAATALDVEDLRTALGYPSWNIIGISYGTRVGLTLMRDVPRSVRSALLFSTEPLDSNFLADRPVGMTRSLEWMFQHCRASPECDAAYPNLEQETFAVIRKLQSHPVEIAMPGSAAFAEGRIHLNGNLFTEALLRMLSTRATMAIVPLFIREVARENKDVLKAIAVPLGGVFSSVDWGAYYSSACYELAPSMQQFDHVALRNQFPRVSPLMENAQFFALPELCRDWHNARAGADDRLPLRSDIPTLLVAGEFDPITPPAYAQQAARTLTKGQYVEIPNAGHGIPWFSVCATQLALKFVDHPEMQVEKQCLASVPSVPFVTEVWLLPGVNRLVSTVQAHVTASLLVVGVLILGLGSSVISPVIWLIRLRRRHSPLTWGAKFILQAVVASAAIVSMVYIGSLAWTIAGIALSDPLLLAFGLPARSWSLYVLPWIILALAAVSLGYFFFTWRIPWTAFERVHTVLMFSSVVLLLISTGFYRLY